MNAPRKPRRPYRPSTIADQLGFRAAVSRLGEQLDAPARGTSRGTPPEPHDPQRVAKCACWINCGRQFLAIAFRLKSSTTPCGCTTSSPSACATSGLILADHGVVVTHGSIRHWSRNPALSLPDGPTRTVVIALDHPSRERLPCAICNSDERCSIPEFNSTGHAIDRQFLFGWPLTIFRFGRHCERSPSAPCPLGGGIDEDHDLGCGRNTQLRWIRCLR
jgi:hypothetical protein